MQAAWATLLPFSYKLKHPKILGRKIRVEGTSGDYLVQPPAQSKVNCEDR